jgi:hypothetical protein
MIGKSGAIISRAATRRTGTTTRPEISDTSPEISGARLETLDSRLHRRGKNVDPIHQRIGMNNGVTRSTEIALNQHVYYSLDWTPDIRTHVRAK